MTTLRIESQSDPRIAPYTGIRERDLVTKHHRFIIESERVLAFALSRSRFQIESILVSDARHPGMERTTAAIPGFDKPIYVASQSVFDAIAGFHIHRGVLAVGLLGPSLDASELVRIAPERSLIVAICGVANHDNVGGIFRNAAAFGAHAVILDHDTCDPLYRKAIRVSVGAALTVPFARVDTGNAIIDVLEANGYAVHAMTPRTSTDVTRMEWAPKTALVFGSEEPGLPESLIARTKPLAIAMSGEIDSLNVATASGIAMHAWSAAKKRG